MELFKKGQKVNVTQYGKSASKFNGGSLPEKGVYSLPSWETIQFEIEGTVQLVDYKSNKEIKYAYLLKCLGVEIGYVYNDSLEAIR